jgi:hypothetical protein
MTAPNCKKEQNAKLLPNSEYADSLQGKLESGQTAAAIHPMLEYAHVDEK